MDQKQLEKIEEISSSSKLEENKLAVSAEDPNRVRSSSDGAKKEKYILSDSSNSTPNITPNSSFTNLTILEEQASKSAPVSRSPSLNNLSAIEKGAIPAPNPQARVTVLPKKAPNIDLYGFAGVHFIFAEHHRGVTNVKFAHNNNDLIAFSSLDGKISICNVLKNPKLIRSLQGHSEPVTDFCWSENNEWILSSSLDKTVRVWAIKNGESIRIMTEDNPCYCVKFYPTNNNLFLYGTETGFVKVGNVSTGKVVQKLSLGSALSRMGSFFNPMNLQFAKLTLSPVKSFGSISSANCMCFNEQGTMLFIGDSKGFIHVYNVDVAGFIGSELEKFQSYSQKSVTCLDFRNFKLKKKEGEKEIEVKQSLLLSTNQDNTIKIFQVHTPSPQMHTPNVLSLEKELKAHCSTEPIRSQFCPVVTDHHGVTVVTGSEDNNVSFLDLSKGAKQSATISKLQGHFAVVYDVAMTEDESFLATCDGTGIVIVWERRKNEEK